MKYTGTTYRPPPEAFTPLLQVTAGCAHNRCSFCDMYRDVQFSVESLQQIEQDIIELKLMYYKMPRLYLVNGDPFVLRAERLLEIVELIKKHAPECETVSMYASVSNIMSKSDDELVQLRAAGINDLYVGVESGWDKVLTLMNKGHTAEEAYSQLERLNRFGINHRDMYILGGAGAGNGMENARKNAQFINKTKPQMIWFGSLTITEGAELWQQRQAGLFKEATGREIIEEEIEALSLIDLDHVVFLGNHPTNTVSISGNLPGDRDHFITTLQQVLDADQAGDLEQVQVRSMI